MKCTYDGTKLHVSRTPTVMGCFVITFCPTCCRVKRVLKRRRRYHKEQ